MITAPAVPQSARQLEVRSSALFELRGRDLRLTALTGQAPHFEVTGSTPRAATGSDGWSYIAAPDHPRWSFAAAGDGGTHVGVRLGPGERLYYDIAPRIRALEVYSEIVPHDPSDGAAIWHLGGGSSIRPFARLRTVTDSALIRFVLNNAGSEDSTATGPSVSAHDHVRVISRIELQGGDEMRATVSVSTNGVDYTTPVVGDWIAIDEANWGRVPGSALTRLWVNSAGGVDLGSTTHVHHRLRASGGVTSVPAPTGAVEIIPGVGTIQVLGHAPDVQAAGADEVEITPEVGIIQVTGYAPEVTTEVGDGAAAVLWEAWAETEDT